MRGVFLLEGFDRFGAFFVKAGRAAFGAAAMGFPYQASASALVTKPLKTAPGYPLTSFWQSGQL